MQYLDKENKPIFKNPLPEYNTIGREEIDSAIKVLNSGILSGFVASPGPNFLGGEHVLALESAFCKTFGRSQAISFNSATSALHCSLIAAGVVENDEVIVPPFTMSATATSVLMCGAQPIFVDIEADTFCIDARLIEDKISSKTKAIIAVNLFGLPANLSQIRAIADKFDLVLIEDNSQAPGALYGDKYTATIGDMGVFSLNRHKTMQCGEGGLVICDNSRLADKLRLARNHGEAVIAELPEAEYKKEDVEIVGYNYRLTSLQAAIALPQLNKLKELNIIRIQLANYLTSCLLEFNFIKPVKVREDCSHVYYLYPMLFDSEVAGMSRDNFLDKMKKELAPISNYARPLYRLPIYKAKSKNPEIFHPKNFPITENLWKNEILVTSICRPPLTFKHIDLFIKAIRKAIASET